MLAPAGDRVSGRVLSDWANYLVRLQTDNLLRIAVSRRWKNAWLLVVLAFFAAPVHAAILTVTKTADTNDGVCNADCSLREAITVANGNGVADLIAFNIPLADPGFNGGTGVWTIVPVGTPLPAIAEPNTTIDGTTQTTNVANTNATVHGTGGLVGFDDLSLSQVNGPEIEIQGQSGFAAGLRASANNTIIRGLAIYGFGNANGDGDIVVDTGVSGGTFEFNVLGARAHLFADPGTRSRAGFATNGGDNWTLQSNVIGFAHNRGAMIRLTSQNWAVRDNEFRDNSLNDLGGDNIAIESSSAPGTVEGNLIAGAASQGVVISGSNANTIVNNTFTDNGVGHTTAAPTQSGALTLRGSADNVTIDRNIFDANYGPGVMINDGSIDNLITRNLFFDNGTIPSRNSSPATGQIGIDLQESSDNQNLGTFPFYNTNDDGDGDSGGNDIFNFAVIKTAQIIGPNLVVSGWSADSATLEFYISDGDPSDFGEGKDFVFTDDEGSAGDSDGGTSFYGPAAVNGVLQGDESPIREYTFTVPTASLPVPVTAADKLVATATLASQTSEFSARAPVDVGTISGTIFVDLVGDGLADGPIGPLPNPYESGTRIELWLDGGDGIPDGGDDTYESFTTSALADGTYQFAGLRNGTYWVTVDAGGVNRGPYNGGYSGADAWAEQTYGPVGAASFDGSSWSYLPAAGALYGGARWNVSNNFPPTNSLPTAEHIGRVIVADNDTTNADFGFSFNVVTTTRGGDGTVDPGQPPGQRTVQGSLRQFLTNANAQTAANIMRFVPAAPTNGSDAGNNWWRVDVTSPLPVIADTATTVDGAAYSNTDGITSIDPNDANIGAGETVGVDLLFTTPILDPELELEVTGIDHGIEVDAASAVIRNISIWKSDEHDLLIGDGGGASFTGTLIEQNVIGTPPHRFDNSFTATGNDLIDVFADADTGILQNNLIGFGDGGGFSPDLGATPWLVFQNEIRGIGRAAGWGPAQDAVGDGAPGIIIRGNLLVDSAGGGVESNLMPGGFTIEQNTFRNNGTVSPETFQIRLMGTTGNSVTRNIFDAGNGPAIIVVSDHGVFPVYGASEANLISQNQFNGNHAGIAIDLLDAGSPSIEHENGDGITLNDGGTVANDGNDGLDFPVIDAVMLGGSLTVTGFARPGVTVEFYKALGTANDQNTGGTEHGEGLEYLFTAVEGSGADSDATTGSYASADYGSDPAANRFSFTVAAPAGLSLGDPVSAIAIDGSNNTSEFGPNLLVTAGSSVAGTVFEDADFAGTATDYDGAVNDLPLPNVDVELYTNTDTYVNSTTTDASGNYSFIVPPATYKIRVRSATIGDSNTPPAGTFNAACGITDPVSGPPCVLAEMTWANGAKYGGDDAAADDTTTNNDAGPGDTWNSIVFAGDQTGINFGFAYNLISNTKDKGQGSLRQFIENANDIGSAAGTTANTSQFRIPATDPGYTVARGVYTISPATELTTVTDAATIIDATTQTSNVADSNGGLLGAGGTVGTGADGVAGTGDDPALGQVAAPEIEIVGTSALDTGINIAANNTEIRGLALYGFGANPNIPNHANVLVQTGFTNTLIEQNVIGTKADTFSDPGAGVRTRAENIRSQIAINGTVRNNLVGFSHGIGIALRGASNGWLIEQNEIRGNAIDESHLDGIEIQGSGVTAQENLVADTHGAGIDSYNGAGSMTIRNNTVTGNGVGYINTLAIPDETPGIRLIASNNTVERNVVFANYGAGIMVGPLSASNTISRNSTYDNGTITNLNSDPATGQIGIDLLKAGEAEDAGTPPYVTLNDPGDVDGDANTLLNYPIIETAGISGANLILAGWARPNSVMEFFITDGDASNFGEGQTYLVTLTEGSGADTDSGSGPYTGLINGINQGDDNTNRFNFTIPIPAGVGLGTNLTATATLAANTSEFSGRATVGGVNKISGTVFLDTIGDVLVDGPIGGANNPGAGSVTAYLYDDTGGTAGQPDATDAAVGSTTTAGDGSYSFSGLVDGTYWVVVDSKTLSADTNLWGEQTYGPLGGWCADGAGGTTQGIGAAGACYGGRRVDPVPASPSSDDLTTWHSGTEHVGEIAVAGGDVSNVNFGFSFNVVTTTRGGGATDDDGANPRTVQGSLRQFIPNANIIAGVNTMRFVPAEPTNASAGANNWWRIDMTAPLDTITGNATTIDGTARDFTDGTGFLNVNDANTGANVSVGTTGTFATLALDPELEIKLDSASDIGLDVQANTCRVRHLSIWGSGSGNDHSDIRVGAVGSPWTGTVIESNVVGAPPNDFGIQGTRSFRDGITVIDADSGTIRGNLIGFVGSTPVAILDEADGWIVRRNEIRGSGQNGEPQRDGLALGTGVDGTTVEGNLFADNQGGGIDSWLGTGSYNILDNTFDNNGLGGTETAAARLFGPDNTFSHNIVTNSVGAGVLVVGDNTAFSFPAALRNDISENNFSANGSIAIDIVAADADVNGGDGITLNDGATVATHGNEKLDFPVIDSAILGGNFVVGGFSRPGVTIEFYKTVSTANDNNSGGTPHGEGVEFLFSVTEGSGADTDATTGPYASADYGSDAAASRFSFSVAPPAGLSLGDFVSAIAIDPADNTSEFGPNIEVTPDIDLSGAVFDDTAGDGLPGAQAIGDAANPGAGSVTVYLYDDTGGTAGQPDATDAAVGSTTSAGDGSYSFSGLVNGTYWVVVDSKTLSADTNVWSEQTYGTQGGWCADGAGGTTEGIGAAGACYGGRRVDPVPANPSSDNLATWYSGAEHLSEIVVSGSDVTDVDFGFSANVVTTTRGGDTTDDDGANPRSVQGSLRQFIQNANAIGGANAMRFVPAEPTNASAGGDNWWQINVTTTFDPITGDATIVDGSAYDRVDGTTLLDGTGADPTPGLLGTGGNVGVTPAGLSQVSKPELELRGSAASNGVTVHSNNSTVRRIAARRFAASIQVASTATGALIEDNILGTGPDAFADPGAGERNAASGIGVGTSASGTIQRNLIGWTGQAAASFSGSGTWTFTDNEAESAGQAFAFADGLAMNGAVNVTITGNRVNNSAGFGISSVGTGARLFEDNSTIGNGVGGSELANIYIKSSNATVRKNIVDSSPGPGVTVVPGVTAVEITGNHFTNNGGTSIDLIAAGGTLTDEREGDGIQLNGGVGACGIDAGAGNDGLDYPVISSAIFSAGNTQIRGTACPNGTVEIYEANAGAGDLDTNGDPHGEGERYVGSGPVDGAGNFDVTLPGFALGDTISAIVIDTSQNTSEFSVNRVSVEELTMIKRAFLPDGTPVGDGESLPVGVEFKFLLYINNKSAAAGDASIRDVLDSLFAFQPGTLQVDNSVGDCAAVACTPAEESAIFASASATPLLTDAVDADVASINGTDTVDVGNQFVANGQLNIAANSVLAVVFSAKIQ